MAISTDSHWLVTGSEDGTTRLWDLKNLAALPIVLSSHKEPVRAVAISPDNHWLVTGGEDKTVRIWDLWSRNSSPL
jgi:WD40 repeat protein